MKIKKIEIVKNQLQRDEKKQEKLVLLSLLEPKKFKQAMVCN